jgi:hypothetical protein
VTRLGDFFANWATFGGSFFCKNEVAQKQLFGLLFVLTNLLHFYLNKQFKNMVCCGYFEIALKFKFVHQVETLF